LARALPGTKKEDQKTEDFPAIATGNQPSGEKGDKGVS
jgi:hypothetical protein